MFLAVEAPSDKSSTHDEDVSKTALHQDKTDANLILRIEKLEQEIALLKERVAK